jgi:hypothetical protein
MGVVYKAEDLKLGRCQQPLCHAETTLREALVNELSGLVQLQASPLTGCHKAFRSARKSLRLLQVVTSGANHALRFLNHALFRRVL